MNIHVKVKPIFPLVMPKPKVKAFNIPKAMTDQAAQLLRDAGWIVIGPKELTS